MPLHPQPPHTLPYVCPLCTCAVTERRIEAARSEMAAASQLTCIVCCANQRDTFLNCGHLICRHCRWAGQAGRLHGRHLCLLAAAGL